MGDELLLKNEVYSIIGAAMEVHNVLGSGFAEPVYQEAMELELGYRRVAFERQKELRIFYKGVCLEKKFFADLLCFGQIVVELKAQRELTDYHEAQVLNYLRATGLRLGLVINFGDPARLDWHRFIV